MSFLNIATSGLQSVIILTPLTKQQWWNFSCPCNVPNTSLSILLYLFSPLDRLLLANDMGHSILLSGALSLGQLVPFLVCSKLAVISTPDTSVSKYNGLVSS